MTLHHQIQKALAPYQGQTLEARTIREIVLATYPDMNPSSLLIADHRSAYDGYTQGVYCNHCVTNPLYDRVSSKRYTILPQLS